MKISNENLKKLFTLISLVVTDGIKAVYEYQKTNSYMPKYNKYPELFFNSIIGDKTFQKLQDTIEAFKYGIPFFTPYSFHAHIDYSKLFSLNDGQYNISCKTLNEFDNLISFFKENYDLWSNLTDKEENIEYYVVFLISNIINRYLYETGDFQDGEINNLVVKDLIKKQIIRLYEEQLAVSICIPICFLEFEKNSIQISNDIVIERMTKEFQISRYNANSFESIQENELVQCANFMIRIKCYMKNEKWDSLHNVISNYWVYPITLIDDLFAAIRIVVGCSTGYGQLLLEPIDWADKWTADLIPLYGTIILAFNRKETNIKKFGYHIEKVNPLQIKEIQKVYNILSKKRKEENKLFNKVFIAIQRLNRCMLRENNDDTALDAIIGIETLLSGDTHGEITYTISNRMSVVAAKLKECPYLPAEARKAMKNIYGFRSDIVHGRNTKKGKISIKGNVIKTEELAIEFLRYALLFIINNQEYLEVQKFEMALDKMSEKEN